MRRLLAISRLLALLALLGLTPSWAMDGDCCCGTEQPVCEIASERQAITPAEVGQLLRLKSAGVSTHCTPTSTDDCVCLRPMDGPTKTLTAHVRPLSEHLAVLSEPLIEVLAKVRPSTEFPLIATPWRPPLPGLTCWSHALFPVPPPPLS